MFADSTDAGRFHSGREISKNRNRVLELVGLEPTTRVFNTTTSMGRLTLNILLSFAQFEREVTSERIRDKITASKRKGLWVGGMVPLGYDVKDRKIWVNEEEAERVRVIFRA